MVANCEVSSGRVRAREGGLTLFAKSKSPGDAPWLQSHFFRSLLPFFMNKLRRIYVQSFVCANAKVGVAVADEAGAGVGREGAMKVASGV